eukprot:UN02620
MKHLEGKSAHSVTKIVVYNRPDCCQDRLNGAKMYLLDEQRANVVPPFELTEKRKQEFKLAPIFHLELPKLHEVSEGTRFILEILFLTVE